MRQYLPLIFRRRGATVTPSRFRQRTSLAAFAAFVASLGLACLAAPASAALYKWTDASGRIVYSDQPPAGNVKYETLGAPPPPANPNAARDLANKDAEFKKRQADQAEASSKAEKAGADAARQRNFCQQVKSQLAGLSQADVAMYRLDDKGQRVMMSDADRKDESAKLVRMARERNCPL
jgi:Skp family chaperone for outer membrane proteins